MSGLRYEWDAAIVTGGGSGLGQALALARDIGRGWLASGGGEILNVTSATTDNGAQARLTRGRGVGGEHIVLSVVI